MNLKPLIAMSAAAFVLSGCGSADDVEELVDDIVGGSAANVVTVSGKTLGLTGTWQTDCGIEGQGTDAARDKRESLAFSNKGVAYANSFYPSSDGSCTGTINADTASGYVATVATKGTLAISQWLNGMRESTNAPKAQDGSTLSDTESFTDLVYTIVTIQNITGAEAGAVVPVGYVVDDTSSNTVLYRVNNNSPEASTGSTADPFFFVKTVQ